MDITRVSRLGTEKRVFKGLIACVYGHAALLTKPHGTSKTELFSLHVNHDVWRTTNTVNQPLNTPSTIQNLNLAFGDLFLKTDKEVDQS